MIKLVELFKNSDGLTAEGLIAKAFKLFPTFVEQSKFHNWWPGDPIPQKGERVLIGIAASYWMPDLKLLDIIQEKITEKTPERIDVFDIVNCKYKEDLDKYILGLGRVAVTPFVGYWKDGELVEKQKGFDALKWLENRYRFVMPPQSEYYTKKSYYKDYKR